jgi:hypothetical protein
MFAALAADIRAMSVGGSRLYFAPLLAAIAHRLPALLAGF